MKIYHSLFAAFFLTITLACSQAEHKTTKPATPAPNAKTEAPIPTTEDIAAQLQTLQENHNILLIRVKGDLSKASQATKNNISTRTSAFNKALEELKTALQEKITLLSKLEAKDELKALDARIAQLQDTYDEEARQFSTLIETLKKERSGY